MEKLKALILLIVVASLGVACKKHVIEFKSEPLAPNAAEFQLHYFVPVVAGAANNITKIDLNGVTILEDATTLSTYNAVPSGGVGRFYATNPGVANLKLYRGPSKELVYDQDITFREGKQNIFVYDFSKPPIIIDNGYPYPGVVTDTTAKSSWIRFYNFLFESGNTPTPLRLQYQYQYNMDPGVTDQRSEWLNVGNPVAFGEATDWIEVPVIKHPNNYTSGGTERIDYRIRVIGADGTDLGPLQVLNSSNVMVDYSDWWNATIGRCAHHILGGYRVTTPISSVRLFYAR